MPTVTTQVPGNLVELSRVGYGNHTSMSCSANVRLYRPQTFMSKRSSIMTLFQAFTKALTKRL